MSSLDNEPGAIAYRAHAAGVAAFGVVGLAFMSLALQYQPISRIALFGDAAPVVSGLIMVGLGLALSLTRSHGWGAFLATRAARPTPASGLSHLGVGRKQACGLRRPVV